MPPMQGRSRDRDGPNGPQRAQDGPKMAPRWLQDGPSWAQDGSKMAPDGPKIVPRRVKTALTFFVKSFGRLLGSFWVSKSIPKSHRKNMTFTMHFRALLKALNGTSG